MAQWLAPIALFAALAPFAYGQSLNTRAYEAGAPPPAATLADIAWLEGHWRGSSSEEIWSAPAGGAMMGMFRYVRQDTTVFYELMALVEENNTLALKLKHFNPDLTGWEEKDEVRVFRLVQRAPNRFYFDGLTVERRGADSVYVYLGDKQADGSVRELVFPYGRVARH